MLCLRHVSLCLGHVLDTSHCPHFGGGHKEVSFSNVWDVSDGVPDMSRPVPILKLQKEDAKKTRAAKVPLA